MPDTQTPRPSRIGRFFSWARFNKKPVKVDATRRLEGLDDDENGTGLATTGTSGSGGGGVSLKELKNGYSEVVETMKSVRSHLEEQSARSDRVLELMQHLPEVLQSIPEANRTQARMLEAIGENLGRSNETSARLSEAISGLTSAAGSQERTLTSIRDHLVEEDQTRAKLNDGVTGLNDTLGHVIASNAATRDAMGTVVEQSRVNDEQMRELYTRSQKTTTAMILIALALATGALALGGYMAYMISQMNTTPVVAP